MRGHLPAGEPSRMEFTMSLRFPPKLDCSTIPDDCALSLDIGKHAANTCIGAQWLSGGKLTNVSICLHPAVRLIGVRLFTQGNATSEQLDTGIRGYWYRQNIGSLPVKFKGVDVLVGEICVKDNRIFFEDGIYNSIWGLYP